MDKRTGGRRTDERTDGERRMDGRMAERTDKWTDGYKEGRIDRRTDGQNDGHKEGLIEVRTDGRKDGGINT